MHSKKGKVIHSGDEGLIIVKGLSTGHILRQDVNQIYRRGGEVKVWGERRKNDPTIKIATNLLLPVTDSSIHCEKRGSCSIVSSSTVYIRDRCDWSPQ